MVNIVFLLLGCVLDVSTIQLVFVPMVLPLVKAFGIDLVHFGVVICLNMMIGLSTPPFGMLLFIVAGLGKTRIAGVIRDPAHGADHDRFAVPCDLCTRYHTVYSKYIYVNGQMFGNKAWEA